MSSTAAVEELRQRIRTIKATLVGLKAKQEQFRRLQLEIASIPKLEMDVNALERAIAVLLDQEAPASPSLFHGKPGAEAQPTSTTTEALPDLIYKIVKEAGKPLTTQQLIPLLAAFGKHPSKAVTRSAVYQAAKRGHRFKIVSPGMFGLLEWS